MEYVSDYEAWRAEQETILMESIIRDVDEVLSNYGLSQSHDARILEALWELLKPAAADVSFEPDADRDGVDWID